MTPSSDLSIIIINWNTRDVTKACLDSLFAALANSPRYAEVFVVDNASTDGSQDMLRTFLPRITLIENTQNVGFAPANNQALRIATGRYLLLLNSDTLILGNVLQQSVHFLDQNPAIGVMGCRVLNEDQTMQPTCFRYPSLFNIFLLTAGLSRAPRPRFLGREQMIHWKRDDQREVDVVTGCYLLVRRVAMEQVGLLDESFFFCGEESDWCRRFKTAGWRITFAPVGEIVHLGNASGKKRRHQRDIMLSEGLVHFLWKHEGKLAARIGWALLWCFNCSHWFVWRLLAMLTGRSTAQDRAAHFSAVTRDFHNAWPKPPAHAPTPTASLPTTVPGAKACTSHT